MKKLIGLLSILMLSLTYSCINDHEIPDAERVLAVEGVAKVVIPNSATEFKDIIFEKRQLKGSEDIFNALSETYQVDDALPFQLYLNVGPLQPKNDEIEITIDLPQDFFNQKPEGYGFEIFAQSIQGGELESLDSYDIIPSTLDTKNNTLIAKLPASLFTSERNSNQTFEIILKLATTPGENLKIAPLRSSATTGCDFSQIACPLGGFDLCPKYQGDVYGDRIDPFNGTIKKHGGIDYRVPVGTPVYAATDGLIINTPPLPGYGNYILVQGKGKSVTLYAHLSKKNVAVGVTVKVGDKIGESGNTGERVTGPHLHFEIIPSGTLVKGKGRVDPSPCISQNQEGAITFRDNGNLADDSFELFLDNISLGVTRIGGVNSQTINNLRPGDKTLRLVCLVAPDNVGTYEVILNNGLFFRDGGNTRSDILPQGGSVSWMVTVPNSSNNLVPIAVVKSKPNSYIEK